MIYLTIAITAFLFTYLGIWIAKIMVERKIEKANISSDKKRMICDLLGIPWN